MSKYNEGAFILKQDIKDAYCSLKESISESTWEKRSVIVEIFCNNFCSTMTSSQSCTSAHQERKMSHLN